MKREEVLSQYKWDLSSLFPNQDTFDENIRRCEDLLTALKQMEGSICKDCESFIAYMETSEAFGSCLDNAYVYAKMCCDVEPEKALNQQNLAKAELLINTQQSDLAFVDLELIRHKEIVDEYLKQPACKDFRYPISCVWKTIPHRLDEAGEKMLADMQDICDNAQRTYQSWRVTFKDVMVDGKPQFLNGATLREFLRNPDAQVRKDAYTNYFSEYKRLSAPMSNLLIGHAKGQVFNAHTRHFNSALEASLFEDDADKKLFDKVCMMANEKYISGFHAYNALKKELLELDELHYYDLNVPLVKNAEIHYTIEECFAILDEALKPLGDDYLSKLHQARDNQWIDFMTHEGKRPGAYSWGTYTSNAYVMMNFTGGYDSLSTLAHELGHSMHSTYSNENNRSMLAGYRIFVAEVASTVNEILLNRYLLSTSDNDEYKAYILYNLLEQLVGTLYRQPMFAQFEAQLHEKIEKGEAVSNQTCMDLFLRLSKENYGPEVLLDETIHGAGCYYVPHFYYNFYVYKYTLGMSVALSFAQKILSGNTSDYLSFLKMGGSESPIDELIHSGVDPNNDEVYNDAFTFFAQTLEEFKELMKK